MRHLGILIIVISCSGSIFGQEKPKPVCLAVSDVRVELSVGAHNWAAITRGGRKRVFSLSGGIEQPNLFGAVYDNRTTTFRGRRGKRKIEIKLSIHNLAGKPETIIRVSQPSRFHLHYSEPGKPDVNGDGSPCK
ncbi:MAG TPA: hypothetical protein VI756_06915 [Blastocatellia bacterium]